MATPLKLERVRRGWSTEKVASAVGVKLPTINRIENGKKRPSPELANRLAQHFENTVTRDQILFPEDYPEPRKKPARAVNAAGAR
jgi:transcriptional regulator with XRE-family HTH domain